MIPDRIQKSDFIDKSFEKDLAKIKKDLTKSEKKLKPIKVGQMFGDYVVVRELKASWNKIIQFIKEYKWIVKEEAISKLDKQLHDLNKKYVDFTNYVEKFQQNPGVVEEFKEVNQSLVKQLREMQNICFIVRLKLSNKTVFNKDNKEDRIINVEDKIRNLIQTFQEGIKHADLKEQVEYDEMSAKLADADSTDDKESKEYKKLWDALAVEDEEPLLRRSKEEKAQARKLPEPKATLEGPLTKVESQHAHLAKNKIKNALLEIKGKVSQFGSKVKDLDQWKADVRNFDEFIKKLPDSKEDIKSLVGEGKALVLILYGDVNQKPLANIFNKIDGDPVKKLEDIVNEFIKGKEPKNPEIWNENIEKINKFLEEMNKPKCTLDQAKMLREEIKDYVQALNKIATGEEKLPHEILDKINNVF